MLSTYDRWLTTDPRHERTRWGDPLDDGDQARDRKRDDEEGEPDGL